MIVPQELARMAQVRLLAPLATPPSPKRQSVASRFSLICNKLAWEAIYGGRLDEADIWADMAHELRDAVIARGEPDPAVVPRAKW